MSDNKRTIPEIRDRLREIADEEDLPELHDLADEMHRRPAATRAPRTSPKVTAGMVREIWKIHKKFPDMHQQDIATRLRVNHGRVSEVLSQPEPEGISDE